MIILGKGKVIHCSVYRQWTSLCSAGSIGIYVYLYSFYYFFFKTKYVCLSVIYIRSYVCVYVRIYKRCMDNQCKPKVLQCKNILYALHRGACAMGTCIVDGTRKFES